MSGVDDARDIVPQGWRDDPMRQGRVAGGRVEAFDPDTLSTRGVVGLAVGGAVALGALVMALGPGEETIVLPPAVAAAVARRDTSGKRKGTAMAEQVAQQPMTAVIKDGKLTRGTRKQLHKQANQLQKEIDRLGKMARAQPAAQHDTAAQQQAPTGGDVREAASQLGDNIGKRLAAAGAATAAATAPLLERARKSELPDQVREGARQFAGTTRDRTGDLTERVREEFMPLLADRAGKLQDRVRDDLVPQVAEQLSRVKDEFLPQMAERLQQVRDDLAPQAAEAASKAGTRLSALAATGVAAGRDAGKGLADTAPGERVGDLANALGKQSKKGRKKAASALHGLAAQIEPEEKRNLGGVWLVAVFAALGGLLFYLFQDEERLKKVTETAQSVVEQGREIVRDFQGYDEEF